MSSQSDAYTIPTNCLSVMAVQTVLNSTQVVSCPQTTVPSPSENLVWIYFPRTCGNPKAVNANCDVWVSFNKSGSGTAGTTSTTGIISTIKRAKPGTTTFNGTSTTSASGSTTTTTGFTSGSTNSICKNGSSSANSSGNPSGASCSTTTQYIVNVEFVAGAATTVGFNDCPAQNVYFFNLDNQVGYHALNDTTDTSTTGLDFIFPECTGSSSNVVYSFTDQSAINAYSSAGFDQAVSLEVLVPSDRINNLFNETTSYLSQNAGTCDTSSTEGKPVCGKACCLNPCAEEGYGFSNECGYGECGYLGEGNCECGNCYQNNCERGFYGEDSSSSSKEYCPKKKKCPKNCEKKCCRKKVSKKKKCRYPKKCYCSRCRRH